MFVSLRLRLFSSASSAGGAAGGSNAGYTIQQAGRDLARAVRQKADLPYDGSSTSRPAFYEFGAEFCRSFDARKMQKELLNAQVQSKLKKDKNSPEVTGADVWNPSKYVQEIIEDAGYLPPLNSGAKGEVDGDAKDQQQQQPGGGEEPFWERNKRAAAIAASHRPVELIKTGKEIHFMNGFFLTRFISDGGKMLPRFKTGLNARQQRKVAKEVRKARQLGVIPIMQKFLPAFEANLPGQMLDNPLAGVWKPSPFKAKRDAAGSNVQGDTLTREEITELSRQIKEEVEAEKEFQPEIKFGLPAVDDLKSEKELQEMILSAKKSVPEIYSLNRLRFRAVEAALTKMSTAEIRSFLDSKGADMSDCSKDEHISFRAMQYLNAFEEHVFHDSKTYNSIRHTHKLRTVFGSKPAHSSHYNSSSSWSVSNSSPRGGGPPSSPTPV